MINRRTFLLTPVAAAPRQSGVESVREAPSAAAPADTPGVAAEGGRAGIRQGRVFLDAGGEYDIAQEATYITTALGMVRAGLGSAVLPESAAEIGRSRRPLKLSRACCVSRALRGAGLAGRNTVTRPSSPQVEEP